MRSLGAWCFCPANKSGAWVLLFSLSRKIFFAAPKKLKAVVALSYESPTQPPTSRFSFHSGRCRQGDTHARHVGKTRARSGRMTVGTFLLWATLTCACAPLLGAAQSAATAEVSVGAPSPPVYTPLAFSFSLFFGARVLKGFELRV
jgi:hypothetical protein